jgi:hypothetical protein
MRPLAFLVTLAACGDPTAPPPAEVPAPSPIVTAPGLWFVGQCSRPVVWFVMRDTDLGPEPRTTRLFAATDSLRFDPAGARTLVWWYELDSTAHPAQSGWAYSDETGVGRITATCLP